MSIWNKTSKRPTWFKDPDQRRRLIATDRGWVIRRTYTDVNSRLRTKDEVLVALRGLANSTNMGTPSVCELYLANTAGGTTIRRTKLLTGRVTFTSASNNVNGTTATAFTTELSVGDLVKIGSQVTRVVSIANTTRMVVNPASSGTVANSAFSKYRKNYVFAVFDEPIRRAAGTLTLTFANTAGGIAGITAVCNVADLVTNANNTVRFTFSANTLGTYKVGAQTIANSMALHTRSRNAGAETASLVVSPTVSNTYGIFSAVN